MSGKIVLLNGGVIIFISAILIFFLKSFIKKAKEDISAAGDARVVIINNSIHNLETGQSEMKESIKGINEKTTQIQLDMKDYIPRKECQDNKKTTDESIIRIHKRIDDKQDKQ